MKYKVVFHQSISKLYRWLLTGKGCNLTSRMTLWPVQIKTALRLASLLLKTAKMTIYVLSAITLGEQTSRLSKNVVSSAWEHTCTQNYPPYRTWTRFCGVSCVQAVLVSFKEVAVVNSWNALCASFNFAGGVKTLSTLNTTTTKVTVPSESSCFTP